RSSEFCRVPVRGLLRAAVLDRARRASRAVGRHLLGLPRADEGDHPPQRGRLHCTLVRLPRAGRRRRPPRDTRPALLRPLPRQCRPVRLRVGWTWLAMTLSFGATLALATGFESLGLPALPLLAVGFLGPNLDLIWRQVRADRAEARSAADE